MPHILVLCNSRMDLTLWQTIEEQGSPVRLVELLPLKEFNKFYNG